MEEWKAGRVEEWQNGAVSRRVTVVLAGLLLCSAEPCSAAPRAWHVRGATLRFSFRVKTAPSHVSAGCILKVPDGGLLPKGRFGTSAVDGRGQPLRSAVVWHDPEQEMAVVADAPAAGTTIHLYAGRMLAPAVWRPSCGLTPSMVVYTAPGRASREAAAGLADGFPPGRGSVFSRLPEPSIGGDPSGRGGAYCAYVLGYLASPDPGPTWFATLGNAEVRIGGRKLAPRTLSDRSGGTGESVDLTGAPTRVEVFFHAQGRGERMRLAWRLPHTAVSELGPGPDGEPDWDARPIKAAECVASGSAELTAAIARDGAPVPVFFAEPTQYFLFEDQPVIMYAFRMLKEGAPANAVYTWDFGNGCSVRGRETVAWLLPGRVTSPVALSAAAGRLRSRCVRSVYGHCPGRQKSRITSAATRKAYRDVFLTMLKAAPPDGDPIAGWTPAMWGLFMQLFEPGEGIELLSYILTERWDSLHRTISPVDRARLEDQFIAAASMFDPEPARAWLNEACRGERDPERRRQFELRLAELAMFYLDDLVTAEKLAAALAAQRTRTGLRARIRMGDIAFLRGDLERAMVHYGEVQNRVRHRNRNDPAAGDPRRRLKRLARNREELRRQRETSRSPARESSSDRRGIEDWRIGAIRDTSTSETARSLIAQQCYGEALRVLSEWEMEFPLSKLRGDYIIVESILRMKLGDYRRALRLLDAYCAAVDMTNYLPEAMKTQIEIMIHLGEPPQKLSEFVARMKRRFPAHPMGTHAESLLRRTRGTDKSRK